MSTFGQWLKDLMRLSTKPGKVKQLRDPESDRKRESVAKLQAMLSELTGDHAKFDEAKALEKAEKHAFQELVKTKLVLEGDHVLAKIDTIMREWQARREVTSLEEKLAGARENLDTIVSRNPVAEHRDELLACAKNVNQKIETSDFAWLQRQIHATQNRIFLSSIKQHLSDVLAEDQDIQRLIAAIEKELGEDSSFDAMWRPNSK